MQLLPCATQVFDIVCMIIFGVAVLFLRLLNAGAMYFWMKDMTQEFLKLHVIYIAVELFDKVRSVYVWESSAILLLCSLKLHTIPNVWM
jgi:Eukaryotic membrane protein family